MLANYHKNISLRGLTNSAEKIQKLEALYNPHFYAKGNFKSKPLAYQLARCYQLKGDFSLADKYYRDALDFYPYEYYILRDYSKFLLRQYDATDLAISLAEKACNIMKHDKELNLLLGECFLLQGDYSTAYNFVQSVYHNDFKYRTDILLTEIFLRRHQKLSESEIHIRNIDLKYNLSLLDRNSDDSLKYKSIEYSILQKKNLESRLVKSLSASGFEVYVRERYINFIKFYSSVWTSKLSISENKRSSIQLLLSRVHSKNLLLKRRYEEGIIQNKEYLGGIESSRSSFLHNLSEILTEKEKLNQFDYEEKFKRLGG